MAHLFKTSFYQDPNVGLYGYANDNFCIVNNRIGEEIVQKIGEVLDVQVYQTNICGTPLVGAFVAGNNSKAVLPHLAFDIEVETFEENNIPFETIMADHTALGNNIAATDDACIISPELSDFEDDIKQALEVERVKEMAVSGIYTVGSLIVANERGCLLSAAATEKTADEIEDFLEVPVTRGTVNLGGHYVRSGIIANSNGFVFGEKTGGPEASHIESALDLAER